MDWVAYGSKGMSFLRKYRYVILAVVAGFLLLSVPGNNTSKEDTLNTDVTIQPQPALETSLAQILSMLEGAGRVEVLLTESHGEEVLYQTNENISSNEHSHDVKRDTVLISEDNRAQTGLIRQRNAPVYLGAIVLCQGADNAGVRLSVVEAVMSVTGLTSDKITVLKMK